HSGLVGCGSHGDCDEVFLRDRISGEPATKSALPESRHRDYSRPFIDYFPGDYGSGLDPPLLADGFRRKVGTGGGKHRVRVDTTAGACPADETADRGKIERERALAASLRWPDARQTLASRM